MTIQFLPLLEVEVLMSKLICKVWSTKTAPNPSSIGIEDAQSPPATFFMNRQNLKISLFLFLPGMSKVPLRRSSF